MRTHESRASDEMSTTFSVLNDTVREAKYVLYFFILQCEISNVFSSHRKNLFSKSLFRIRSKHFLKNENRDDIIDHFQHKFGKVEVTIKSLDERIAKTDEHIEESLNGVSSKVEERFEAVDKHIEEKFSDMREWTKTFMSDFKQEFTSEVRQLFAEVRRDARADKIQEVVEEVQTRVREEEVEASQSPSKPSSPRVGKPARPSPGEAARLSATLVSQVVMSALAPTPHSTLALGSLPPLPSPAQIASSSLSPASNQPPNRQQPSETHQSQPTSPVSNANSTPRQEGSRMSASSSGKKSISSGTYLPRRGSAQVKRESSQNR